MPCETEWYNEQTASYLPGLRVVDGVMSMEYAFIYTLLLLVLNFSPLLPLIQIFACAVKEPSFVIPFISFIISLANTVHASNIDIECLLLSVHFHSPLLTFYFLYIFIHFISFLWKLFADKLHI
jgi:hypothetical protein